MNDINMNDTYSKNLIMNMLENHLNLMFKTQMREIWESFVQPKSPTVEEMRKDVLAIMVTKDIEEISRFILENTPRKQRGMNGGRRKKVVET
jgi:hypothetical protein